jgi:transcriptional regulator with XRE-family HTH domain
MKFGKAVRIARTVRGLSQKELAERLAFDASYICLLEAGRRKPTDQILKKISRTLRLPVELLELIGAEKKDLEMLNPRQAQKLSTSLLKIVTQHSTF